MSSCIALALGGCRAPDSEPPPPGAPAPESAGSSPPTLWSGRGKAPLLLLISLDTLRADHLGIYGYERGTSPNLDRFGAEGAVFEDASSTAPWTLPAHASLLTGMYAARHRVETGHSTLARDTPTLAAALRKAGFETAAVVNSGWLNQSKYFVTKDFEKFLWVEEDPHRRSPSSWVTDQAITWLRGRRPADPMFLFVHYYDLHADYASEPTYEKRFAEPYDGPATGTAVELMYANAEEDWVEFCKKNFATPRGDTYCKGIRVLEGLQIDDSFEPPVYDEADVAHLRNLYDASILQMDAEIGRLFDFLRGEQLLDDALIFVVSDHGEEFGEHGGTDHMRTQYQEVLRVPVMVRGPGVPPGTRIGTEISLVDIAPTILAAAGVSPDGPLDGFDLSPLWSGGDETHFRDRPIFGETGFAIAVSHNIEELKANAPVTRAVRKGSFKLYYDKRAAKPYALYDLASDPGETTDVSAEHPELVASLTKLMEEHFRPRPDAEAPPPPLLSPEDKARLRSLGYVN